MGISSVARETRLHDLQNPRMQWSWILNATLSLVAQPGTGFEPTDTSAASWYLLFAH